MWFGSWSVDGIGFGGCWGKFVMFDSCWFLSILLSCWSLVRSCCVSVFWFMMVFVMELVDFEDVGIGLVVLFVMVRIEGV